MFEIFNNEKTKSLFKNIILKDILEKYLSEEDCSEATFDEFDFSYINLDILEERKILIPFKKWKTLQTSKNPIVQNVFWNVCDTKNVAHHEIRDGINEMIQNEIAQGNILVRFIFTEQNGSYCCFWLYTRKINEELFFNATVMVLPRIGDLLGFDDNGNCIHK